MQDVLCCVALLHLMYAFFFCQIVFFTHINQSWNMQGPALELFENDPEREQHYADALSMSSFEFVNDAAIAAEMEAALKEYDQVGADLGIIPTSCKFFADDPSWLTRWLIGEEKVPRI